MNGDFFVNPGMVRMTVELDASGLVAIEQYAKTLG
jgi:hypothetical protein